MSITVHCNDASHPAKRPNVFVAEFERAPGGVLWMPKVQRRSQPSVKWWLNDEGHMEVRPGARREFLHHDMWCRYCKAHPLSVRVGKLDAVLDQIAEVGRVAITLSELRAILNASGHDLALNWRRSKPVT